jgi:hypothetical protein
LFDPLAAARGDVEEKPKPPRVHVAAGDRVRHMKFGEGLVLEASGDYATVMFDAVGKKKLSLEVAVIEKVL